MLVGEAEGAEAGQRVGGRVRGVRAAGAYDGRDIGLGVLLQVEGSIGLVGVDGPIAVAGREGVGVNGVD